MTQNSKPNFAPTGTLVRLKGGKKDFEFFGEHQEGRIVLKDPTTGIFYLVRIDEADWELTSREREPT